MVKRVSNMISDEEFAVMRRKVIEMNTGIEDLIFAEMETHRECYDSLTGERFTEFDPPYGSTYMRVPLIAPDGAMVNCELLYPATPADGAVLYIHGAAFMRRTNDLNLRTADRLSSMSGHLVCVPDYRIGADYTYDQMVMDVIVGYRFLTEKLGYSPDKVAIMGDSSGCVTALQVLREMDKRGFTPPGKVVLWSPPVHERIDRDKVNEGKERDFAFCSNDLLYLSNSVYYNKVCAGMRVEDMYPIYGDFSFLKDSSVLIQAGASEMLLEDSLRLYDVMVDICPCTLEVYEEMFHNFQAYYSICEMSKACWKSVIGYLTGAES